MIKIRNQAEFDAVFVTGIANLPQNEIIRIIPIPQGYEVKAPIVITKSNVIIQGYGVVRPIIKGQFRVIGIANTELENIIVECLDVYGIYAEYCGKAQTTGLPGGGYDALTVGKDKINKIGIIIKDCWVKEEHSQGIVIKYSANCKLSSCVVQKSGSPAIELLQSNNNLITGNLSHDTVSGIIIDESNNNIIEGNTFSNSRMGIYNFTGVQNIIINNIIQNNTEHGLFMLNAYRNSILGNIIQENGEYGIKLVGGNALSDNTITGNIIQSNGLGGISEESNPKLVLMANTINQETGIHIKSVSANVLILGNVMTGAGTGLTMSGTGSKQVDNIKAETAVV